MNTTCLCCCLLFTALTGVIVGENIQEYICNQQFTGYKLDYARRRCVKGKATGCVDPFPYKTKYKCMSDFRGKGNLCDSSPCRNGGMCLPVTTVKKSRTFKCDCYATGYYGRRCHRKCPKVLNRRSKQTACILIG